MPMIPGAPPLGGPPAPDMPMLPGAPPPPMMGSPFPSLDPSTMMQALAPVAALQQADKMRLQAQQDATVTTILDAMKSAPNPAAQAAMVEPGGAPTSALGAAPAPDGSSGGY